MALVSSHFRLFQPLKSSLEKSASIE